MAASGAAPGAGERRLAPPLIGIFVGGRGRRMGGVAKGLLRRDGRPLIEHIIEACAAAAAPGAAELCLVGDAAAYTGVGLSSVPDAPAGIGPIGGLRALLLEARRAGRDALAVAVDLPYVEAGLLRRLASECPDAALLAPREAGRWQPLLARYRPACALPALEAALASGATSLQSVFAHLVPPAAAVELSLSHAERRALLDWDEPADIAREIPDRTS